VLERTIEGGRRPITDILGDIGRDLQDLLRSEILLIESQVREQLISRARSAGVLVAMGVIGGLLSVFFLLLGVLYMLRLLMPAWAAAFAIAAALALIATVALTVGVRRLRASPYPGKRFANAKEQVEWGRQPTK
jgi:uncharacterized membrane protein